MLLQNKLAFASMLLVSLFAARAPAAAKAPAAGKIVVAAPDFEYHGDWELRSDLHQNALIFPPEGASLPAVTAVRVPRAGKYRLWVCCRDFPNDRPGTRTFKVAVGGKTSPTTFGTGGKEGYTWQDGGWFELSDGPVLVSLESARPYARVQGVVLTTDAAFQPHTPVGHGPLAPTKPLVLGAGSTHQLHSQLKITSDHPSAAVATDAARIEFFPATRDGAETLAVRAWVKTPAGWIDAGADAEAEGYFAVTTGENAKLNHAGFYAVWPNDRRQKPVEVEAGGVKVRTVPGRSSRAMWDAGALSRFVPRRAIQQGPAVKIEFDPTPAGKLEALWEPGPDGRSARVTLTLDPAADGQVALGYELFFRREIGAVSEVLLPMMWHRHRLPEYPTTLLDNCTPTPIALAQPAEPAGERARCLAIVGEPADKPFAWPDGTAAHSGLSITDATGRVHPSVWGPVIGTPGAAAHPGRPVRFRFRVLAQAGDWYAAYRTAADRIDGVTDYRSNVTVSLTDAALNMIDLVLDDTHGGWWPRAKAFYQIETKNGGTHAAPMLPLSLYRLTGNQRMYRERALPTMEFMLSRDGPHFSPEPSDTGPYPPGSMNGPVKLFGTTTFGGLWELTGRRTDAFGDLALPDKDVRPTAGYSHEQPFDDWLSRYELTGQKEDLNKACELADAYVRNQIATPPARDLGPQPFFYISFVPDWEGLLRLYETTGQQKYLDAAAFGARQLMTGIWTQPVIPDGPATIHPGGEFVGEARHEWWKGPERYRLDWPPKPGDIREHSVPAWVVSNVGLGFEQPITFNPSAAARQIFEEQWAPHFLRLYRYTKDPAFLTYARNAVVGRWGNYPGYYITGHTDLPEDPNYPLHGPDVTDIYYHHIPAHLAWTIDYLVSEAEVLSDGNVTFPSLREDGYAYFDSRLFGAAPGRVFDDPAARLIFRRGLVTLNNPQVNYLTAHGPHDFHVILTNQSRREQKVTVALSADALKFDPNAQLGGRLRIGTGEPTLMKLQGGRATVILPPRALAVLTASGVTLDVAADVVPLAGATPRPGAVITLQGGVAQTRAAAIQVDPGPWDAYIWSTASPAQAKSATLHYSTGDAWKSVEANAYPFEFSIPVADEKTTIHFRVDLNQPDGSTVTGPEGTLSLGR